MKYTIEELLQEKCPDCGGSCDIWFDWGGNQMLFSTRDFADVEYQAYLVCAHPGCEMNLDNSGHTKAPLDLGIQAALREVDVDFPRDTRVSRFWPTGGHRICGPRPTGSIF